MPAASSLSSPPLDLPPGERPFNRQIAPPLELGLPYWFHLFFPDRALTTNLRILVVGCDDGLAVRLAKANPRARVTAVETRAELRAAAEQAAARQNLANLDPVADWPRIAAPDQAFDLVYYNPPSWPGESPRSVLATAAGLLHLEGSLHLTVPARYAWSGVSIVRELFERLGVEPDAEGYPRARQIVAALKPGHPWNLLLPDPPLRSDELLADWLGSDAPCFTVPGLYELLEASSLRLQRFTYQSYYLPQCSPLGRTPLLAAVRQLPLERQHALMELYWPGMRYHLAIACRADRPPETFQIDFGGADWLLYAPLLPANLPLEQDESLGAQTRLCWRAAGMPELAVSLGAFQHRLLRALDRAEELAEVVGQAGLSGDPQLRDEWARDFFHLMADYDFLHFRICHSPRQAPPNLSREPFALEPPAPMTPAPITEEPVREEPVAGAGPESAEVETPQPGTAEGANAEPATPEPATPEPATPEPATAEAATPQSRASEPPPAVTRAQQPPRLPDRIPYEACPLCAGIGYEPLREAAAELAVGGAVLRAAMPWVRCRRCAHVFTSGYFGGESWMPILQQAIRWRRDLRFAIRQRGEASRVVSAITTLRESAGGRWLDVGCSNSGLVAVAAEFGYTTAGVDCCRDAARLLAGLGYSVTSGSLFDCDARPYDVISLSGAVENMPFPAQALNHVRRLLAPRGLVYVSASTSDSLRWKKLDSEGANPHWSSLNRYHAFRRQTLFQLLRGAGLEPCSYGACGASGVGMEVIACKP